MSSLLQDEVSALLSVRCTHPSLIFMAPFQYLRVCYIGEPRTTPTAPDVASPVLSREDRSPAFTCWHAFPKADQFGKILASSFTAVVKTTVTGFRKRTWVWNCLTYYASKLIIYTTVHFQNYTEVIGSY